MDSNSRNIENKVKEDSQKEKKDEKSDKPEIVNKNDNKISLQEFCKICGDTYAESIITSYLTANRMEFKDHKYREWEKLLFKIKETPC